MNIVWNVKTIGILIIGINIILIILYLIYRLTKKHPKFDKILNTLSKAVKDNEFIQRKLSALQKQKEEEHEIPPDLLEPLPINDEYVPDKNAPIEVEQKKEEEPFFEVPVRKKKKTTVAPTKPKKPAFVKPQSTAGQMEDDEYDEAYYANNDKEMQDVHKYRVQDIEDIKSRMLTDLNDIEGVYNENPVFNLLDNRNRRPKYDKMEDRDKFNNKSHLRQRIQSAQKHNAKNIIVEYLGGAITNELENVLNNKHRRK